MNRNNTHPDGQLFEQRQYLDRRRQTFKSFVCSLSKSRRVNPRRTVEAEHGYYTDQYEKSVGLNVIAITLLSAIDAFLTLNILARGGIEVNPFMLALMNINTNAFLIGKLSITVVCLLFALVHINFNVLRIFPMRYMLGAISMFYTILIAYEVFLLATI